VLITGAAQRIGLYLAQQFLQETDYPIVFTYRTYKPAVQQLIAQGAVGIQVDFEKEAELNAFLQSVMERCVSLRLVIHNASLWLSDDRPNALQRQWQVHVQAPFLINQTLKTLLQACSEPHADIISITDTHVGKARANQSAYLATKAALRQVSLCAALEYAPKVKVNDLALGLILFNASDSDAYKQQRLARSPIPLEPGPQVVWQTVYYLIKNGYTTGTVLTLDGGVGLSLGPAMMSLDQ
jgi:dihydromonapterin reductase/dihydrofolate reductase